MEWSDRSMDNSGWNKIWRENRIGIKFRRFMNNEMLNKNSMVKHSMKDG